MPTLVHVCKIFVDTVRFIFDPQWLRVHCPASFLICQRVQRPSCSYARMYLLIYHNVLANTIQHTMAYLLIYQGVLGEYTPGGGVDTPGCIR